MNIAYQVIIWYLLYNKTKEAEPMDNQSIITHISRMLLDFEEGPLRAVYMVVKQMHDMHRP